jgi:hypothetical protein
MIVKPAAAAALAPKFHYCSLLICCNQARRVARLCSALFTDPYFAQCLQLKTEWRFNSPGPFMAALSFLPFSRKTVRFSYPNRSSLQMFDSALVTISTNFSFPRRHSTSSISHLFPGATHLESNDYYSSKGGLKGRYAILLESRSSL